MFFIGCFSSEEEAGKFRQEKLAQLQKALSDAKSGSAEWYRLQGKIRSLSQPRRPVRSLPRRGNEATQPPNVDPRKARGVLQDVRAGLGVNPNVETKDRFAPGIKAMQMASILPGQNGEYKAGTTWGPKAVVSSKWADQDEDEDDDWALGDWAKGKATIEDPDNSDQKDVDTSHAFQPRHNRPRRAGLMYHGFDGVYLHQRDGKPFTSADVIGMPWKKQQDEFIQLTSEDVTEAHVVKGRLEISNPVFNKQSAALQDDLKTILENHERITQQKKQGLSVRARPAAGARGSATAPASALPRNG